MNSARNGHLASAVDITLTDERPSPDEAHYSTIQIIPLRTQRKISSAIIQIIKTNSIRI